MRRLEEDRADQQSVVPAFRAVFSVEGLGSLSLASARGVVLRSQEAAIEGVEMASRPLIVACARGQKCSAREREREMKRRERVRSEPYLFFLLRYAALCCRHFVNLDTDRPTDRHKLLFAARGHCALGGP